MFVIAADDEAGGKLGSKNAGDVAVTAATKRLLSVNRF
jgi:hypothetical protein